MTIRLLDYCTPQEMERNLRSYDPLFANVTTTPADHVLGLKVADDLQRSLLTLNACDKRQLCEGISPQYLGGALPGAYYMVQEAFKRTLRILFPTKGDEVYEACIDCGEPPSDVVPRMIEAAKQEARQRELDDLADAHWDNRHDTPDAYWLANCPECIRHAADGRDLTPAEYLAELKAQAGN